MAGHMPRGALSLICKSESSTNHRQLGGYRQRPATGARVVTTRCCKSAMAAARGLVLVRELLRPQGNTAATHRLRGMGLGVTAGFLGASAVASASDGGAACPAYPLPQDGARGGQKVFMQHDCAACHSMLPYAGGLTETEAAVEAKAAEIVVVVHQEQAQPAAPAPLHGAACPPDLSVIERMLEGLRRSNLCNADELRKRTALPSPAWLQFLQPYIRTPQAA